MKKQSWTHVTGLRSRFIAALFRVDPALYENFKAIAIIGEPSPAGEKGKNVKQV